MNKNLLIKFVAGTIAFVTTPMVAMGQPSLTRQDLLTLVQKNDVRTVEQLLPLLPSEYRQHFILVHTGHGAQETSVSSPRVLMFGNNAKMVLAMNGQPTQKGYFDFEFREFNETTRQFEYGAIQFKADQSKPTVTGVNPAACLQCHGQKPLPILDHYFSSWSGIYQDNSPDSKKEPLPKEYLAWINSASSHPRYQHLEKKFMPPPVDPAIPVTDHASFQPLNMLAKLQSRLVGRHVAAEIEQDPYFNQLRYTYMHLFLVRGYLASPDSPMRKACIQDAHISQVFKVMRDGLQTRFAKESFAPALQAKLNHETELNRFEYSLLPLLFGYHHELSRYRLQVPNLPLIPVTYRDGVDAPYLHAWMEMFGEEINQQTELGKLMKWEKGRMTNFFGARYSGETAFYFDEALTWPALNPAKSDFDPQVCKILIQKSQEELAKFTGWK